MSTWVTDEMVVRAIGAYDEVPTYGTANGRRDAMRHALEAITPMVEKLIGDAQASEGELMRQAGYEAGVKKGRRQGEMFGRQQIIDAYNEALFAQRVEVS